MAETWITGLLTAAQRLRNSRTGNPRWQLKIGGMSYTTELDADVANQIDFGHRVPEMCTFRINRAGRIIGYIGMKEQAGEAPPQLKCEVCGTPITRLFAGGAKVCGPGCAIAQGV